MLSQARSRATGLLICALLPAGASAATGADPAAAFNQAISAAEGSLRDGEVQIAESRYRTALLEGWLLVGTLERIDGRLPEAREAFRSASTSAVENRMALQALALTHLQMGEPAQAITILRRQAESGKDPQTRRLLAEALLAGGETDRAVEELEAAHRATPGDLELAFALARGYLEQRKVDLAARLFAQIVAARPIPQTNVLIGRTYTDFEMYEPARAALRAALARDPRARRAHYYLGMAAAKELGRSGLDEAIAEFQAELQTAPQDVLANLELGSALVDVQRPEEALPSLEIAARAEPARARVLYYLGRAQLARDRPADAAASLKRALQLAEGQGANRDALRTIHIHLGQALRKLGQTDEAAVHFGEAERSSAEGTDAARERMARYMTDDVPEVTAAKAAAVPMIESSPLAELAPPQRLEVKSRVSAALARAYLNLGVMKAQAERFSRAAEMFEKAAMVDPAFPQVQSSLGVAYFNARQFAKATGPLERALAAAPDPALKRLLAMAWLNTETYDKAAELLRDDPERGTNPSLQFAYGLALVKSGRAAEAESIFARLLAQNGDSAELSVLLGQAHAQQGDFDSAIESLQRALRLKADVADANATLGVIYWKQGRLPEAETALRAELKAHPTDVQSRQNLAVVLDAQQRPEEALVLLRGVLQTKPDFADARYLLGKILLAQGTAEEAVEHLEAAARLAPEDANVHYQLGRAYQKLGRTELAEKELEVYRQIKDRRR
ncbi:MAG: tetratricopeptide repeat protein [Solirubrobacterales bacterium]